jgi:quercetin dioxygenase-like cupin family protein
MVRVNVESDGAGENSADCPAACVYTMLIGGYEELNEQPVAASSSIPFICLTDDRDLCSETWEIRCVEPLFAMDYVRSQRAIKLLPFKFLPEFDRSLYIDNTVVLKTEPERLIGQYLGASGFSLLEHSFRSTVLDEFREVENQGLDDPGRISEQLNHYTMECPEVLQEKPYWTAILLRNHQDQKVRAMLELWNAHVQRYSRRDQLSVNLAFRRSGLQPNVFRIDNHNSWFHSWPHIRQRNRSPVSCSPGGSLPFRVRELERENECLAASVTELRSSLDEQTLQNKALLASTSWITTAPMRAAAITYRSLVHSVWPGWRRGARVRTLDAVEPWLAKREQKCAPHIDRPARVLDSCDVDSGAFFREGFTEPLNLFTSAQCELILKHYRLGAPPVPVEWPKGRAANDRFFYEIATRPRLRALLKPILGEDIVLWGASIVEREPGQTHIWHTDIESSAIDGRFVSVWIGLENTSRETALKFISRSHEFGRPIQQEVHERGLRRGEATDEMITAWARERDSLSTFMQPEISDGQALLSDGRLWHASHNGGPRCRVALLLQYAAAETPVVIPEYGHVEWPFHFTSVAPPSILVSGNDKTRRTVPPPSACPPHACPVSTNVHSGDGLLESANGWVPYPLFHGPTPIVAAMESHVSVLSSGQSPHPPHCHVEEELLIVLEGEAEILIATGPDPAGAKVERLHAGEFVYYPAYQHHTIRNSSSAPVVYLMFKWQASPTEVDRPLETKIFDVGDTEESRNLDPMSMRVLFEAPTAYLDRLHAHVTELEPGAGYPDHSDEHDVAIVVFSGLVETLGKRVGPMGSIYYSAGRPHGMQNTGHEIARYLVFEFHGSKPFVCAGSATD